jgi:hypothetical protein
MLKKLLSVMLAAAVVSQGIARADEPGPPAGVSIVKDRATLMAHIDGLAEGDRIVLATDDGVLAGEFVEKDADDLLMDRPLLEGGAERITIPLNEIRGVQYQTTSAQRRDAVGKAVIVVVLVGVGVWLWRALLRPMP